MDQLFDQIPLDQMNTSMTINATAAWLLSLYIGLAQRRGIDPKDAERHDPERHHQGIPVARHLHLSAGPSMRLIADTINYTVKHVPKWNPTNVCSYHLQEAGATPVQELAYALCTAMAVLDRVKASGEISRMSFPRSSSGSRSSSMPASASSRSAASCGPSAKCGTS
jgi:(2R)-ethylmalonyl-CoA mutase